MILLEKQKNAFTNNGKLKTLPGIAKEYVFEKLSTSCMLNAFGCLINELRKDNICFETYTFHKSKKVVECKGYGKNYPVLTRSIITDIVDQIINGSFTFEEMLDIMIEEVEKQSGRSIVYYVKKKSK